MLRRNDMLCRKTQPKYNLRVRAVQVTNGCGNKVPVNAVSNADRKRNLTHFDSQLMDRISAIKAEQL
jgi:hypothetical protein